MVPREITETIIIINIICHSLYHTTDGIIFLYNNFECISKQKKSYYQQNNNSLEYCLFQMRMLFEVYVLILIYIYCTY